MASEPGTTPAPPEQNAAMNTDQPIVDLVIVSPSVGVPQPLRFPGLPASTTIRQLKGKIRDTLALHPTETNQRLIHRGRALVREGDTLLEILGADSIAADQQQTMHLVIRDIGNTVQPSMQPAPTPTTNTGTRDSGPASGNGTQAQRHSIQSPQEYISMVQRRLMQQTNAMEQIINQHQWGRAQLGMRGIGDTNPAQGANVDIRDRRASPAPNGRTYRADASGRTASGAPNGLTTADVQNIIQNVDASQATVTMTTAMNNAMQRSGSAASMHTRPLTQPGVTVPVFPGPGSRAGSGRTTPFGIVGSSRSAPRSGQEVYILSSPEGPRALLVNNATAETYYTPRLSTRRSLPRMYNQGLGQMLPDFQRAQSTGSQPLPHPQTLPGFQNPNIAQFPTPYQDPATPESLRPPVPQGQQSGFPSPHPSPQPHTQQAQPAQPAQPPQLQAQGQPAIQAPMGHGLGHPQMHPPVAAVPPLLRVLWPHLWLIFRLALFVWIFTSPGASWSRWMTIIGLAALIFVLSTGALNGVAEHIMGPVGRHLNNLLPALDDQHRRLDHAPNPANAPAPAAAGPGRDPQPQHLAQRLLDNRRAREGWFTGQFRRVERASLLFLASIAPGVAERHIAHLEAEAARQRRETEEAAAREAAETENRNNEGGTGGGEEATQEGSEIQPQEIENGGQTGDEPRQGLEREPDAAPEPLIAL